MRRKGKILTESQIRYLRENHRKHAILEKKIDMIVKRELDEALSKRAKNWLAGGAAAAGLLYGISQLPSDADMFNLDHLITVKQNIEMEYGRPLEEIPPYEIQYFYDECEKYGIEPEDVKTPIVNY